MSEWLYPLTLPPLFLVYPDEKPILRQADSQREQEFKALPAWSERVFEDWCHDLLGEDAGFGLIDIPKPDDWHLSVKNAELDEMIGAAHAALKSVLVSEEKAAVRRFKLADALGPLPERGHPLGQMSMEINQALQEELLDLAKAQIAPTMAQTVIDMGLSYFDVVNPIQSVMAIVDDPKNLMNWASTAQSLYGLYNAMSGAATGTAAGAGAAAGASAGAAAGTGAVAAGGATGFAAAPAAAAMIPLAVIATIGLDVYSNRKSRKYAEHISNKIERIFRREVGEIQEVVTDAMDLLIDTFDKMKIDIEEKVRLRKKDMNQAAAQAILTGHGALRTKKFRAVVEEDVTETQEYEQVIKRRQVATVSAIAAIALAQAIIREAL